MTAALPFTLRQLDVFTALCATRSFRLAAEQLGISQASVSNQVKALEEQLGVALFLRRPGKRPALSAEGLAFQKDLNVFYAAAQALANHRRGGTPGPKRLHLRVRVGRGLMDNYIRPKLHEFLVENPDISLQFDAQPPSGRASSEIKAARFDFAILHLRSDHPVDPIFRKLAVVQGGIYGHRKFAEGRELPLSPQQVSDLPFILPEEGSSQEQEVHTAFRKAGIAPQTVVGRTSYYDVVASMLAQGLGVASFAEVIVPPAMRGDVVLLCGLHDWRLVWYCRDPAGDERLKLVERFLLSCLLNNPDYIAAAVSEEMPSFVAEAG